MLFDQDGILQTQIVEEALKTYYYSTGVSIQAINEYGETIAAYGDALSFCKIFGEYTGASCPCSQAHLYASKQAMSIGDAYIFFCPAGLVQITTALLHKRIFKGALIAGPLLMDYPDEIIVDEIIQKIIYISKQKANSKAI